MVSVGKVLFAAVLCFAFVRSDTDIFKKHPSDGKFNLGQSTTIDCLVTEEATTCTWIRDGKAIIIDDKNYALPKRSEKGNCQLRIAKTYLHDAALWTCGVHTAGGQFLSKSATLRAESSPTPPTITVDGKYTLGNTDVLLSPENVSYHIELAIKKGYPLLVKTGTLYVNQDGVPIIPDIVLKDSTEVNGANDLIATFTVKVLKTTKLAFVTKHPAIFNQERTTEIMFKTDDLRVNYLAIARPTSATVVFELEPEQGQTIRKATFRWYNQPNGMTDWVEVPNQNKNKLELKGPLKPGNYSYRVSAVQEQLLNVKMESPVIHLLAYEELSDVAITSPPPDATNIKTKRGNPVTLQCSAKGYPEAEFHWVKATQDGMEVVRKSQNVTLGYEVAESGRYKCGATQALLGQRLIREAKEVVTLSVE